MKLVDLTVNSYLDILKSNAPAPGGGSVSALAGAQAVGLVMMVTDLTIGREKYADYQEVCKEAKEKGAVLFEKLTKAIDEDTDAYNLVANAFKMPRETEEEKTARKQAIADGTMVATQIPYNVMGYAYEGLLLTKTMIGKSNPNATSDLGVAALGLLSAVKGAWLNVKINLPGVKDENKAKAFAEEGQKICKESEMLANAIYEEIANQL